MAVETKEWITFTIGLMRQEYNTMRSQFKRSERMKEMKDKFLIVSEYSEPGVDCVMLEIKAESGEIIYKVAQWIAFCHENQKNTFGADYKIDPDWDEPKYNSTTLKYN